MSDLETRGVSLMVARLVRFFVVSLPKVFVVALIGLSAVSPSYSGTTTYDYDVQGQLRTVTAPSNGADQSITAYTYDDGGNRATVIASIGDNTPPNVPTGLTANAVTSQQIHLNWTPTLDVGGGPVAYYNVYRGGALLASPNGPPFDDWPLTPNTAYSYTASAVDGASHESAQSGAAGATTLPDTTPPSAPTGLQGSAASGTTVNLMWSASTDTGGSGLAGYEIMRNNGGTPIGTSSTTSFSDQTASSGVTYLYNVRAYDGAGNRSSLLPESTEISEDFASLGLPMPYGPQGASVEALARWSAQRLMRRCRRCVIRPESRALVPRQARRPVSAGTTLSLAEPAVLIGAR